MSCARYHELISRYADNEVTPRQRQELLYHVEHCRECAAWLARVRQAEVLLKGVPETRPSDRVRSAVLETVREQKGQRAPSPSTLRPQGAGLVPGLGLGFLLRFDLSPGRIALVAAACVVAMTALAYQLNILQPLWGYDKLGFEVAGESDETLGVTPVPAISSGLQGLGGPVAVPNLVRLLPEAEARDVATTEPLRVRFDQPMDRASVETVMQIDPPASGAFTWDADNEVRFTPDPPGLLRGVTYRVTISDTARSLAGTPLKEPLSWSFSTSDLPTVNPDLMPGTPLAPGSSIALTFSTPMDAAAAEDHIALRDAVSGRNLQATLAWDPAATHLTITPSGDLPPAGVVLVVSPLSRTQSGETLGRGYAFSYEAVASSPRLRLTSDRLLVAPADKPLGVEFEAIAAEGALRDGRDLALQGVQVAVYPLGAERLSVLAAGPRGSSGRLPEGLLQGLQPLTAQAARTGPDANGAAQLPAPGPGLYLLVVEAPSDAGVLYDWQVVIVTDSTLQPVGEGGPLWAVGPDGRAWAGAEVSLYSASGTLIEKGLTGGSGLWLPYIGGKDAAFAVAQDAGGHIAAHFCTGTSAGCDAPAPRVDTSLDLLTDRPAYYPGDAVSFRVMLNEAREADQGTPVAEQDVIVRLVMPGGAVVSALKLKPDDAGGMGGVFNLAAGAQTGEWALRVQSGAVERDFPLDVRPLPSGGLSVYISPVEMQPLQANEVTRTLSILGPGGAPAAGAEVTATLRIHGDNWSTLPVNLIADANGRASVALSLPDWTVSYNDPGLYLHIEADWNGERGSAQSYLDLTSARSALAGMRQLVSPDMGIAAVALPPAEGNTRLRVVELGAGTAAGDLLVLALSPAGEQESWSIDLSVAGGDVTLPIAPGYAGGRVIISRAGAPQSRVLHLLPPTDAGVALQVTSAATAAPGSSVEVAIDLHSVDESQPLAGSATVLFRPVSGADVPGDWQTWEPAATIVVGKGTLSLQAPAGPGLYYVLVRAVTERRDVAWGWSVLRVTAGPAVQIPPQISGVNGEAQTVPVVVHNPTSERLSATLRAEGGPALTLLGNNSQNLDIAAGGSQRLIWRVVPAEIGSSSLRLFFGPSTGVEGEWLVPVHAANNPATKLTYISGSLTDEKTVGVQVPSGLPDGAVELEIHASTSLLDTLGGIAGALPSDGAPGAAARLSAEASALSAYRRLGAGALPQLSPSAVEQSLLLQQVYSGQNADGSWSGQGADGQVATTASVLLSMRRYSLSVADGREEASAPEVDANVIGKGLAYLSEQAHRPLPASSTQAQLDEMAYAFYALSTYDLLDAELARPLVERAGTETGDLSVSGQAWLALALIEAGDPHTGLALVDRLARRVGTGSQPTASAPLLASLLTAPTALGVGIEHSRPVEQGSYEAAAEPMVRALMGARKGSGWRSPAEDADTLWALSLYAVATGDKPYRRSPSLALNGQAVQVPAEAGKTGIASIVVADDALHAGTNWLKLEAPSGRTLYYSLTLKATR